MARKRGLGRVHRALPLVMSFLLVALLAAGLGYAMGLFLTGALSGDPVDAEPDPGSAGEPASGSGDPGTGAGAGPEPGDGEVPPVDVAPGAETGDDGQDPEPAEPASSDTGRGDAEPEPPPEDQPGDGQEAGGETRVNAAAVTLYVVQVGVFSSADGAQVLLDDLRAAGFDGVIAGGDAHRVWTGLFTSREHGRALADAIAAAGFENFIAEHSVGGSGLLPGGSGEAPGILRDHLEALPDRIRRLAVVVESGAGAAQLIDELLAAERQLEQLEPAPDLEDVHQSLLRLHAQIRSLLQEAGPGAGVDAHPALLAGAAEAAVEAAAILARLPR